MDEIIRTFTHLDLINQAVEDIIRYSKKKRRDGHFPLQLPKETENDHSALTPEERYVFMEGKLNDARDSLENETLKLEEVDDRLLLKAMKTKTIGRKSLGYGKTRGLAYNLYYHRDPSRRGRSVREKNIPSRLKLQFKQYPPVPEEQLKEYYSRPPYEIPPRDQFDSDEAWQGEDQKRAKEYLDKYAPLYGPLLKELKKAMTPIATMTIKIGWHGKNPTRKLNKLTSIPPGKGLTSTIEFLRQEEQKRRKAGKPPSGIIPKWLWIPPFKDSSIEYIRSYVRLYLAFYLLQENMAALSKNEIHEIFEEYFRLLNIRTENLPEREYFLSLLSDLYTDFDLPQDWCELRDTILKLWRKFRYKKNNREIITDDLEKIQERRVREGKGFKRSYIPKEEPEEKLISVDRVISQLKAEGLEVSRDTIYRWIRERKVPVTQNRWRKIRLTQESIEQLRQILEQKRILKQGQEKRKNLMEYLIEGKGMSPEAAKKHIYRQRKAGKTIEDMAREQLVIRPSQKPGADIGHEWGEQDE